MILALSADRRLVTSERGAVVAVCADGLTVQFDDGRREALTGEQLDGSRLDHAYALTAHRMQGATVDRGHVLADGGRELAYVAMSRARDASQVYVVADDADQAVEDLRAEWSRDRRSRWVLDVNEPAVAGKAQRPSLMRRTEVGLRLGRLRAEREAVQAVAPDALDRLRRLDRELSLERVAQPQSKQRWFGGLR